MMLANETNFDCAANSFYSLVTFDHYQDTFETAGDSYHSFNSL